MNAGRISTILLSMVLTSFSYSSAQTSAVIVFSDPEFQAADSFTPSATQISAAFPDAKIAHADELGVVLTSPASRLLVLPFASAFPEAAWPQIQLFLDRGGNLLVVGGRPFTRSAYRDSKGWHLRNYSVRFARALMIDQYQAAPGSQGLDFQTNPDLPLQI